MTTNIADLVARFLPRINGTGIWLAAGPDEDMQAMLTALEDIARERDEARESNANLFSIISDIREASGLGGKPMLGELAGAVGRIAGDLAYAKQALDRETARAIKFGRKITAAEAEVSRLKQALAAIDGVIGNSIRQNGDEKFTLHIDGEQHEGPAVEFLGYALTSLQKLARSALADEVVK